MTKRYIDSAMLNSLRDTYVKDTAQFQKTLFHLSIIENVSKTDLKRIEKMIKSEMFADKLVYLATQYLADKSILTKLKIQRELKHLGIKTLVFLMLVDDLKHSLQSEPV